MTKSVKGVENVPARPGEVAPPTGSRPKEWEQQLDATFSQWAPPARPFVTADWRIREFLGGCAEMIDRHEDGTVNVDDALELISEQITGEYLYARAIEIRPRKSDAAWRPLVAGRDLTDRTWVAERAVEALEQLAVEGVALTVQQSWRLFEVIRRAGPRACDGDFELVRRAGAR